MIKLVLVTLCATATIGNSALASTEECEAAERRMANIRDETVWAARQYAICVENGDSYDDCSTWIVQVRVQHDEFTGQLYNVQRKCP